MSDFVRIELLPLGRALAVERGTPLQDVLFDQGVEFPCGGRGRCKGCRVKVLDGRWPPGEEERRLLQPVEIEDGWRLSCRAQADADLKLELAQWETPILADNSLFQFTPQDGLGVAVDLGTTTLVAQLLDLRTSHVLAVRSALNAQARHGADIMSRIDFAVAGAGQARLEQIIREQIGGLLKELLQLSGRPAADLRHIVVVGNTVMHHLFSGVSVEPLAHHPFEPADDGLQVFSAAALGWEVAGSAAVRFLPSLGGFVGSDILAGILATKLHESRELTGLVDLGTNGEIVIGTHERMLCASTAAGPAFEGARISMGMRAATGAISEVNVRNGQLQCHVIGHATARGVCGSGLVDAVAGSLQLGWINPAGKLVDRGSLPLAGPVALTQRDVRELQLAKGAIAAGIRLLTQQWGAQIADLKQIYLAGAFGNYISRASARRIGLLPFGPDKVVPAGNTALLGAKLALFSLQEGDGSYDELRRKVQHVSLNEDPRFHEVYVEEMGFAG
jgi:uncharacterized 2Fe-2S/4Fe-4S cluster protein (DUF4445 family)